MIASKERRLNQLEKDSGNGRLVCLWVETAGQVSEARAQHRIDHPEDANAKVIVVIGGIP